MNTEKPLFVSLLTRSLVAADISPFSSAEPDEIENNYIDIRFCAIEHESLFFSNTELSETNERKQYVLPFFTSGLQLYVVICINVANKSSRFLLFMVQVALALGFRAETIPMTNSFQRSDILNLVMVH